MLNFIITEYLKQEVDDDISVCVNERSSSGHSITGDKYLSTSRDKGNDVANPNRSVLWTSIKGLLLLAKFDNSSLSRDIEICQMIIRE